MDPRRSKRLNNNKYLGGSVIYWMSRDQRVEDNWALFHALELSQKHRTSLSVVFVLEPNFLEATLRQYDFMIQGLIEVEVRLRELNIPFYLSIGSITEKIPEFIDYIGAGYLISDFSPLKITKSWREQVNKAIKIPFEMVDSHNIIPVWEASDKQEYAAYTLRKKINERLEEFLVPIPKVGPQDLDLPKSVNWDNAYNSLRVDMSIRPVTDIPPGEKAATQHLKRFLSSELLRYEERNDPNADAQSGFSPYLHFGQISAHKIALEIMKIETNEDQKNAFIEELIIRRELSDNYCYYNGYYDNFNGFPEWGRKTLNKHRKDRRPYIYSKTQFENAETHDPLWNAAQTEMTTTGKMNGYMRMYWCKKVLEWSESPEEAQQIAIYLNDKYELDGRDPNGYAGIAWSIGGVHDRPWKEREIYGMVRYMNYNGCKRKFDVERYIDKFIQ